MVSRRVIMFPALLLCVSVAFVSAQGRHFNIPPHEDVARMARFVVNRCDWASLATISTHEPVKGQPFSNAFSISDGGTGTPYLYLTHLEISVQDLQENPQASMSVSLAQTSFCKHMGYDPQSPLCAHIILSGSMQEVNGTEADVAKKALFSRHPEMIDWPIDHNWFFAKMNITQVWVLDYFGGVKTVSPEEYYKATPYEHHWEYFLMRKASGVLIRQRRYLELRKNIFLPSLEDRLAATPDHPAHLSQFSYHRPAPCTLCRIRYSKELSYSVTKVVPED